MGIESVNDGKIQQLLLLSKQVTNPNARETDKESHLQKNFNLKSSDGDIFTLYVRQNKRVKEDFSCGLSWHMPSGETLTLVRCNGSSHFHPNRLEKTSVDFACHIHKATERYIEANLKPEGFAESTDRYSTVKGALHVLVTDYNISGIMTEPDHPDLFL